MIYSSFHIHVLYNLTDPPENVKLTLARNGKAATIKCTADAQPPASFKIFLTINKTKLVKGYEMYAISEVRCSDVGNYICVAENKLGNKDSNSEYLSLEGKSTFFGNWHIFKKHTNNSICEQPFCIDLI